MPGVLIRLRDAFCAEERALRQPRVLATELFAWKLGANTMLRCATACGEPGRSVMSKSPVRARPADRRSVLLVLGAGGMLAILGLLMLNAYDLLDGSRGSLREVTVIGTVGDGISARTWVGDPAAEPETWRQLTQAGIAYHDGARITVQPARVLPDRLRTDLLRSGRPLLDVAPEGVAGSFLLALGLAICLVVPKPTRRLGGILLYAAMAVPGCALLLRAAEIGWDLKDAQARGVLLSATILGTAYAEDTDRRSTGKRHAPAAPRALLAFTTPDHRMVVTTSAYRFRHADRERGNTVAVRYRHDDTRHVVLEDDWYGPGLPLLIYGASGVLVLGLWAGAGLLYLRLRTK